MSFLKNNPFIKILSFSLLGILLGKYFPDSIWLLASIIAAISSYLLFHKSKTNDIHKGWLPSVLLILIISILFVILVKHQPQKPSIKSGKEYSYEAEAISFPEEKTNSYQVILKIEQANTEGLNKQQIIGYFAKNEKVLEIQPGDRLFINAYINEVSNPGNPYEFDYQSYLSRQNIYFTSYISEDNFKIEKSNPTSLTLYAERIRGKLLKLLKSALNNQQAFEVVSALTLGYRDELTEETQSYFTSTGAMHVLAVSGLHVGMIFMFLSWLLSSLKRSSTGRVANFFIIFISLWCYALLTGFSPSVQRATVMFSFILIGNSLNRSASTYNSIAASAFFLLLINPQMIWEVGFQLSYMAVISIVFFYPRIEKILTPKNRFLIKIWQLFCVSLSAQIGTFALSVYYFNQFPLYFWLSNFIVIPAAFLILGLTLVLLVSFSFSVQIPLFLGQIISYITNLLLTLLEMIGDFPSALIQGLSISKAQLFILLLGTLFIALVIKLKSKTILFFVLGCFLLYQSTGIIEKIKLFNQREIISYNSDDLLIHLIDGRENYLLTTSGTIPNEYLYENVILKLKLNDPTIINISDATRLSDNDLIISNKLVHFNRQTFKIKNGTVEFLNNQ